MREASTTADSYLARADPDDREITLLLGTFGGDRQVGLYQLAALVTLAAAAAAVVAMSGRRRRSLEDAGS